MVSKERLFLAGGDRTVGLVQLYSVGTGEPLAFMPDGIIQAMRVGGTYGLAVKYLARSDATRMGLLGSGWQAKFQVAAAAEARRKSLQSERGSSRALCTLNERAT